MEIISFPNSSSRMYERVVTLLYMLSVFLSPILLKSYFLDFFLEVDLASDFLSFFSLTGILDLSSLVLLQVLAVAIWNWKVAAIYASSSFSERIKADIEITFILVPTIWSFKYPSNNLTDKANVYFLNCIYPHILLNIFMHFIL